MKRRGAASAEKYAEAPRLISASAAPLRLLLLLVSPALFALWAAFVSADDNAAETQREQHFREQVAPLLARRCLSCHNDTERKGGLSLQQREAALSGGDSGPVMVPGDIDSSYLAELITPADGRAEMPKDADPLAPAEIEAVRTWIRDGCVWPDGFVIEEARVVNTDWWSLRPLVRPDLPRLATEDQVWVRTPVDAFVIDALRRQQLAPSPEADRRTLIRRLYFDLIGLPPTPAEIEQFVHDRRPLAYERLVDRLLDSPHYGERWARHWLDVVHYGDTHGYDKDKLRPNAWPYRDYVIRSLNSDKPYGLFLQEQIAGDVLFPDSPEAIVATGFIAAGPWDFISHVEVPETKIDGQIARSLDRDDMVRTTMETFASVTIGCARCHHHKFDPITQQDYYSLQAVFAAVDRADRPYDADPAIARRRAELMQQRSALDARQKAIDEKVQQLVGPQLAKIEAQIAELDQQAGSNARPEFGYHSAIESSDTIAKWVQADLGDIKEISRVTLVGCHDDFNAIGAGFGFPPRLLVQASNDEQFKQDVVTIADHTTDDYPNPGVTPQTFVPSGTLAARYVRVTATRLAPRMNDFIFALAELAVLSPDGQNLSRGARVTALDSIEAPVRWQKVNLVDGYYFGVQQDQELQKKRSDLEQMQESLLKGALSESDQRELHTIRASLESLATALQELPQPNIVYAAATHFQAQGSFQPTLGVPREIRILQRGNILQPGELAVPGALAALHALPARFEPAATELDPSAEEGWRRAALAHWLVHPQQPLTWRSIANRVWLYHFGRGIVDTPNDFGRMGQLPTHPELLDWLAAELRDGGQSLKSLHRLICNSATYRQTSAHRPAAAEVDADNRYLWRMNRRRLEAEAVRDAVLQLAGKLDQQMYGPGFQDFVIDKPEHSPHYEYHRHDPDDPASHRRSIYRFIVRSQQQPFMTTLDCADPSMQVEKRNETVTALQALALLNNKFMIAMADHFAERLEREQADLPGRVVWGFQLAVGQHPDPPLQQQLQAYAQDHGLPNLCRVLLNMNQFMFVD